MTAPLSLTGYRLASFLATPLAGPILAMRLKRGKEDSRRIGERRGLTGLVRPPGPLVWLHGASVGEAQAEIGLEDEHAVRRVRGGFVEQERRGVAPVEPLVRREVDGLVE